MGVNIACSGNLVKKFKTETQQSGRVTGWLNDLVWRNKYMRNETKSKGKCTPGNDICTRNKSGNIKSQSNVRSKWDENTKENSWQNNNRIRSRQIREPCNIQQINEWVERRRREGDQHVTRMDAEIR